MMRRLREVEWRYFMRRRLLRYIVPAAKSVMALATDPGSISGDWMGTRAHAGSAIAATKIAMGHTIVAARAVACSNRIASNMAFSPVVHGQCGVRKVHVSALFSAS